MKKVLPLLFLALVSSLLFLTGCDNNNEIVAQEPPRESSIFRQGEIEYCLVTKSTEVKAGAGDSFPTITTLNQGEEVRTLGKFNNWYIVQLQNNRVGCISTEDARPIVKEEETTPPSADPENPPAQEEPNQPGEPADPTPDEEEAQQPEQPEQPSGDNANMEQQMVDLVNQERTKAGLQALTVEAELTRIARLKSQDMVDNNYFSHYSPTYGSPFEMLDSFGVKYLYAGENLAGNSSVSKAHTSLMGSSGHRQNILNPNFTHIGIGIVKDQRYGYIFTQLFIGK